MDALLVVIIALAAIILFVREVWPPDVVAVLVLGSLTLFGLVTPKEAVSGFSSPATIAVGAMFLLSAGLRETGALNGVARFLAHVGINGPILALVMMLTVAVVSGFINNTAAVAVFLPVVIGVARRRRISASKLLIPLSFASQFGGVCTLIGTSTNLVVNSLAVGAGLSGFGMFDFAPIGFLLVAVGTFYLLSVGWWLLPNRPISDAPGDAYALNEYICTMEVLDGSRLIGRTVKQGGFGSGNEIVLVELVREGRRILAHDSLVVEIGDTLLLRGAVDVLLELAPREGLRLESETAAGVALEGDGLQLVELLLSPTAFANGRSLASLDSPGLKRAAAIAIARRGSVLHDKLLTTPLLAGDALLLLIPAEDLQALREDNDFIVLSTRENPSERRRRAPLAIAIVVTVVAISALQWMAVEILALLGAAAMVIGRCVGTARLYRSVELRVLVLLAAMLPLGIALEKTGAATTLVSVLLSLLPLDQPLVALALIYALTALLTEVVSNNATAVLMTPIAMALAAQLGVRPEPFLVAVAFAASTSFSTPIGYQTNTMVYSTGGYTFRDFLRVGVPLNVLFWAISMWAIPRWFPF